MTTPILRAVAILVIIVPTFGCFIVETIGSWPICTNFIATVAHITIITGRTFFAIFSAIWVYCRDAMCALTYGLWDALFTDKSGVT